MKRFDNSTLSGVVRWSLVASLAVTCAAAFAAGSPDVAPAVAGQAAVVKGPLTLMIESPAGGAVRLTYVPDEGWKAEPVVTVAKQIAGRVATVSAPQPEAVADLDDATRKPMTVFIDGPTGYTYFWSRERGWKFIGRLTERLQ